MHVSGQSLDRRGEAREVALRREAVVAGLDQLDCDVVRFELRALQQAQEIQAEGNPFSLRLVVQLTVATVPKVPGAKRRASSALQ